MTQLDRRTALSSLAAGAAVALGPSSEAKSRTGFFERIGRPIGLQLYTLGDEPTRDLDGTLAQVAAIGYRDIEIPGLFGKTAAAVKAAAARAGLTISSKHVPADSAFSGGDTGLTGDIGKLVDELGALGVGQAVLPIVPFPPGLRFTSMETIGRDILAAIAAIGPDHWKRTAALLNEKAAALKPHGISLSYHNHNIEFAPVSGETGPETASDTANETGWSILRRETDPALVQFEIDVAWVAAAGMDPVVFLDEHRGRVGQIHVKDSHAATQTNFTIAMAPAEVGSGTLDWAAILPAAHRAGVRHYYVEQEPPFAIPRFEAIARSYAYLARLRA